MTTAVGWKLFVLNANNACVMTWDKFLPMIKTIGWNDQVAMQMWNTVDQDRSGSLDEREFMQFCGNGSVTQYIRQCEMSLPDPIGVKLFNHIDGQGGGPSDGRIDWNEFLPLILKVGWNQQTAMQMWYTVDQDRSGFLSRTEFIIFCNRSDVKPYLKQCEDSIPSPTPGFGPPGGGFGAPGGGFGAPGGGVPAPSTTTVGTVITTTTEEKGGGGGDGGGDTWDLETCERIVDEGMAETAAQALRKAMKGFGTNEKAINAVLCDKSKAEIQAIRAAFTNKVGRNLIKDLKSETGGNYENLLVALTLGPAEYDATLIRKAVKGMGTNEGMLSEVLATRSPSEIVAMQEAYGQVFKGRSMITDIENDVSGNLEKVYTTLLQNNRTDGSDVAGDILALYKAGEKKFGTDEGVFIRLLAGYSRAYVEKLYWAYAEKYGKALNLVIKSEFSGHLKKILQALCTPIDIQFSKKIKEAMSGMGTDDNDLVRMIATMKERHLRKIAKRFLQDHQKTLLKWVDGDTSGDYGKLMVGVVKHWGNLT